MASTNHRRASGSQGGFALVLAVAVFTVSLFLWSDARAASFPTPGVQPAASEMSPPIN